MEIDLAAVAHNVSAAARWKKPICAVVKADGYGHGDVPLAEAMLAAGAERLAVALVEEGVRLREAGITAPILLLSEPPVDDLAEAAHWRLTLTVYRTTTVDLLAAGEPVEVEIKIDTGMHRVGAPPDEVLALLARIEEAPNLWLKGIWSHLAVADEDPDFTAHQIAEFDKTTHGIGLPRHLANTAAAALFPDSRFDEIRIGLGLYGLYPCSEARPVVDLRPAMRVVSHIAYTQRQVKGSRPSYGRRRPLTDDATLATIPIGYADGVPRLWSEGEVLVKGRRYPIAGTITMDQMIVDVGDDAVAVGDEVVLLGRQGSEEITVDDWAGAAQTIAYEIVTGIGPRLPRRYLG